MSYTGDPTNRSVDAVRLLVGDTSTSSAGEYMADAEYAWFLSEADGNVYSAASVAADSLAMAAAAGGIIEKHVGDLRLKYDFAAYSKMAEKYARSAAVLASPSCGGISKGDKRGVISDSDRVVPYFQRNKFDNPEALPVNPLSPLST